jgi:glyoxylase-like metal-dependent hydrolase (beta-lactamase superfamily II)
MREQAWEYGSADEVIVHVVSEGTMPGFVGTAWGGFENEPRVYTAFEIRAGQKRLVVDAPHTEELHALVPGAGAYHPERFAALESAMADSNMIVLTHTHGDHVAGIPFGTEPEATASKLFLNTAQYELLAAMGMPEEPSIRAMGFPTELLSATKRLSDKPWQWLAPGVALISAPGHTAGHQILYVATENHELLLLGDLVWTLDNITEGRTRPRLVSKLVIGEDTDAVTEQLAAVIALAESSPDILMLPSHDPVALHRALQAGAVQLTK